MAKHSGYMDRALRAQDPRYARILTKLGYARRDLVAKAAPVDDLAGLREEYRAVIGKKAFHGWDAATIRAKIEEAQGS